MVGLQPCHFSTYCIGVEEQNNLGGTAVSVTIGVGSVVAVGGAAVSVGTITWETAVAVDVTAGSSPEQPTPTKIRQKTIQVNNLVRIRLFFYSDAAGFTSQTGWHINGGFVLAEDRVEAGEA